MEPRPPFGTLPSSVPIQEACARVSQNLEKVILGKTESIRLVMVALLCEGHVLVEDVPGVGKTTLAQAVARSLGCTFARIQCTPDLLPGDLIGVNVFNQKDGDFMFRPGPVHHQIVLADEVNRATPKTQSALLECMEERQTTVDGVTHKLPRPFLVLATQNPVEFGGTYPLPEAQLDRFLLRIHLGYPDLDAETEMVLRQARGERSSLADQVMGADELTRLQEEVHGVKVSDELRRYVVQLVRATREYSGVVLGASPRGSLALYRCSQALAALEGRSYVIPDDIQQMAVPTLSHRLVAERSRGEQIVGDILAQVPVPIVRGGS